MKDFLGLVIATVGIVAILVFGAPALSEYANPSGAQIDTSLFVP